jgi:hypothetical protein
MQNIRDAVKAMRKATFERTPQWTLGQLIEALSKIDADEDCWVSFAFADFVPTTCDSWRGSYDEIAIGYDELEWEKRPMLKDFLSHLRNCVGQEFTGWKGGEFTMHDDTPVWVANPGRSGNTGVVGIHQEVGANGKVYRVNVRADYCEF